MSTQLPEDVLKYRKYLENLDHEILTLLAKRMGVARLIIKRKQELALGVEDLDREQLLLNQYIEFGLSNKLSKEFVLNTYNLVFSEAKRDSQKG